MVNSVTFAKRLKQIMAYYNLNASSFSDTIDFNRSTISHLLSGRNKPSLEFVMKVLNNFPEVTIEWLLEGKGAFPRNQEILNFKEEIDTTVTPSIEEKQNKIDNTEIPIVGAPTPFEQDQAPKTSNTLAAKKKISRIVIFYTDSSFEAYEN